MNYWIKKSFQLHNSEKYLDRLLDIYPMLNNEIRELPPDFIRELKTAFELKDDNKLFEMLLPLDKFPIKDSFKAYFSRTPKKERHIIIKNNPDTVKRICNRIYTLGFDKMIEGIQEPKETNRQIGPMFKNWIRNQYPSYSNPIEFINSNNYISVLSASDDGLVKFVKNHLKTELPKGSSGNEKGLDMVVKVNTKPIATFVIGEAKFLTDEGGHQNAQLRDALYLITSPNFKNKGNYNVIRIAILDGVCWISSKSAKMQKEIRGLNDNQIAISALLLDDFFKSL